MAVVALTRSTLFITPTAAQNRPKNCERVGALSLIQKLMAGDAEGVDAEAMVFCNALRGFIARIDDLEEANRQLHDYVARLEKRIHPGTLIAFDSADECPDGWRPIRNLER